MSVLVVLVDFDKKYADVNMIIRDENAILNQIAIADPIHAICALKRLLTTIRLMRDVIKILITNTIA